MYKLNSISGDDVADSNALFTLSKVKSWCFVTSTTYDSLLTSLVTAARQYAEARTWRQIIPASYTLYMDKFPISNELIQIWKNPVISISSIKYYDADNVLQTLSSSLYDVDISSEPSRLKPVDGEIWPVTYDRLNAVEIAFTAGYDESDTFHTMPESIALAIELLVSHWFVNRSEVVVSDGRSVDTKQIPMAAESLLETVSLREFV